MWIPRLGSHFWRKNDFIVLHVLRTTPGDTSGRLAQMVERSLSMREAPGSIPGFSSMKISTSFTEDSQFLQVFVFHLCVPDKVRLTELTWNDLNWPDLKKLTWTERTTWQVNFFCELNWTESILLHWFQFSSEFRWVSYENLTCRRDPDLTAVRQPYLPILVFFEKWMVPK